MVEVVGMHGFDDGQVVRNLGEKGEPIGKLGPGLSVLGEGKAWAEDRGIRLDESIALALDHRGRDGLALDFLELGLVVEELELAGKAGHEQIDHPLGLDGKRMKSGLSEAPKDSLASRDARAILPTPIPQSLKK